MKSIELEIEMYCDIKEPVHQDHAHLSRNLLAVRDVVSAYQEVLLPQEIEGSLDVGICALELLDRVGFSQKRRQLVAVQLPLLFKELMA